MLGASCWVLSADSWSSAFLERLRLTTREAPIARMDTGREAIMLSYATQKCAEGLLLLPGERRAERIVVLAHDTFGLTLITIAWVASFLELRDRLFTSLIVGARMIAKGMALVFAGNPQAAYATGGVFKPTHAVTMHGILLLPLLAWLLSFADWNERRRLVVVIVAAAGYIGFAAIVAIANFTG